MRGIISPGFLCLLLCDGRPCCSVSFSFKRIHLKSLSWTFTVLFGPILYWSSSQRFILFSFEWVFCLHMSRTTFVPGALGGWEMESNPLELEFQMVMSNNMSVELKLGSL